MHVANAAMDFVSSQVRLYILLVVFFFFSEILFAMRKIGTASLVQVRDRLSRCKTWKRGSKAPNHEQQSKKPSAKELNILFPGDLNRVFE